MSNSQNEKAFALSIKCAKELMSYSTDSAHNLQHVQSVVCFALRIAEKYPTIDKNVIAVSAWWHDVGRSYHSVHEGLSGNLAYNNLLKLGVPECICKKIYLAIAFHKSSMQPISLEGEIVRDADKLDFISVNRWKAGLADLNYDMLGGIAVKIPQLRDEILHLSISKSIFDERYSTFIDFIKKLELTDDRFLIIRSGVLSHK